MIPPYLYFKEYHKLRCFWKTLHRWQIFYTNAGCTSCANYQLWLCLLISVVFSERDKGNLHGNCQKSLETLRIFCFISGYQIECEKKSFLSVWVGPFTQSWFFFERQLVRYAQAHARTWCISTVVCHCKRQTTNEMEGFCEVSFFIIPSVDFKSKKVPSARVPNASRIVVKILNKFKKWQY